MSQGEYIKNSFAELLWLYYDYTTEMYDRSLPHHESPHEKGEAMVFPHYRRFSDQYARQVRRFINGVAEYYGVTSEEMHHEKIRRNWQTTVSRMERFEFYQERMPEKLAFIYTYQEIQEREMREKIAHLLSSGVFDPDNRKLWEWKKDDNN